MTATSPLTSEFRRGIRAVMKATRIAGGCEDADCPAVYVTDEPEVVLAQGLPVQHVDGAPRAR
jgi:hypothetical protein